MPVGVWKHRSDGVEISVIVQTVYRDALSLSHIRSFEDGLSALAADTALDSHRIGTELRDQAAFPQLLDRGFWQAVHRGASAIVEGRLPNSGRRGMECDGSRIGLMIKACLC